MSDLNAQHNRAVWFDIPVADLERASAFYAAVLGVPIHAEKFEDFAFGVIDHAEGNGGCLVPMPEQIGGPKGLLVYFNAEGRIRDAVARAGEHGGEILQDVHAIGPHGFRALLMDSEGNRIALHSSRDA